ncbi:MAG TPA: adenosylcobinamide-GDP ribazoletransferase, partial [Devosiaceae bacterium]|nr:adenosylcobinamide-GDP ribazoletransferase [Devosiaceae bacterium]
IAPVLSVAGLVIGAGPALLLALGVLFGIPALFASCMALVAWVIVTGAMAEDGLADAMDGLFGASTAERRLEILKDPHHGTYGVSALVLSFLLRASALAALAFASPVAGALCWLGITVASRSFALWLPATMRPARADGAAAAAGTVTMPKFVAGAALAALVFGATVLPVAGPAGAAAALGVMALTILGWRALCHLLVGGYTGDLIGGGQLLLEIACLSFFMVWVG